MATEQQRLEAEHRRQYFESLSPQQQEAYLSEQRTRQKKADVAATIFLLEMFSIGAETDSAVSPDNSTTDSTTCWRPLGDGRWEHVCSE